MPRLGPECSVFFASHPMWFIWRLPIRLAAVKDAENDALIECDHVFQRRFGPLDLFHSSPSRRIAVSCGMPLPPSRCSQTRASATSRFSSSVSGSSSTGALRRAALTGLTIASSSVFPFLRAVIRCHYMYRQVTIMRDGALRRAPKTRGTQFRTTPPADFLLGSGSHHPCAPEG